jgi:hypothetical protein
MAEVRNRIENPSPDLVFQEIHIPDDSNCGTGTFRFLAKKDVLVPPSRPEPKALVAMVLNPPRFQVSVSVNPGTREIPVLLGRADGSPPISARAFVLPSGLDTAAAHEFRAVFRNWRVLSLEMDGQELEVIE